MKIRIVFLLLLLCCSLQSRGQYVIPGAEQQPAWVFPLYFEDDIGSRDTVYIGYDPQSISGGGWPFYHDTIFGERYIPYDTIGFLTYLDVNPWWFESDSILKVIVTSELNQANIQLRDCKLPLTMRWSSQKFYDDTLPFPDNSPLPRIEIVLWPSDLSTTGNGFGDNCGFTEPIMLSDTSSSSYECTFSDSIVLDSWGCPGCLFSGDFDLVFRSWTGGWVGVEEAPPFVQILAYPNPTSDVLNVIVPSSLAYSVELVDMLGRTVSNSENCQGTEILDLDQLPIGCYLLIVRSSEGVMLMKKTLYKSKF